MLSSGKRILTLALVMAANALSGRGEATMRLAAPGVVRRPERPAKTKHKKRRAGSRFTWLRWRVPAGGGAREVERRRRQIEAGTLLTSAGQARLREGRAQPVWVARGETASLEEARARYYGVDPGKPGDDVTVFANVDQTRAVEIIKHTSLGRSQDGVVIVE